MGGADMTVRTVMTVRLVLWLALINIEAGSTFQGSRASMRLARVQRRGIITSRRQEQLISRRFKGSSRASKVMWNSNAVDELPVLNAQQLFRHRFLVAPDFCIR